MTAADPHVRPERHHRPDQNRRFGSDRGKRSGGVGWPADRRWL